MKFCPQCESEYPGGDKCPNDGTSLIDQTPRPDPLVGQVVNDHYELIEKIARGGMGTVFRAKHKRTGGAVAVKVLHDTLREQPDAVKRFFREAKSLAQLRHPNIVEFLDCGQMQSGQLYMAMEFLHGQTLDQLVRARGPLPIDLVATLLTQVCHAVNAAHAAKVIHRDLTPLNIIIAKSKDGHEVVKLVDFGIAKNAESHTQITQTGIVMGTPGYLAPEQITGEMSADPRSDIYAIGAVLYFMLGAKRPYSGPTPQAILAKQVVSAPEPLDFDALGLPSALKPVVYRAMAKDPEERFQSATELLDAFGAALGQRQMTEDELAERFTMTLNAYRRTAGVADANDFGKALAKPLHARTIQTLVRQRSAKRFGLAAAIVIAALAGAEWIGRGGRDVRALGAALSAALKPTPAKQQPVAANKPAVTRGVSAREVSIGMSADFSGVTRESGRALLTGIKTAFSAINEDEGGVYGRKLQITALDDAGEPEKAAKNAAELLDKRAVFALVGGIGSATAASILPEVVPRDSVLFGPVTGAGFLRERPIPKHLFFYRPSYAEEATALVDHLVEESKINPRNIAVFSEDGPGGEDCKNAVVKQLDRQGHPDAKGAIVAKYPANTMEVDAAIDQLAAASAHVKAVVLCSDAWPAARLLTGLKTKRHRPLFAGVSMVAGSILEEEFGKHAAQVLPGTIISQVVPPYTSDNTFVADYRRYLSKYATESRPGFVSFEGYIIGRLFAMALKIAGPEPTTEKLIAASESMREVEFGTGGSIRFGAMDHQGSHSLWLTTWNDKMELVSLSATPIDTED